MPYRSNHTILLNDIENHLAHIAEILDKLLKLAEKAASEDQPQK